jgi:hypothetical protein
MNLFSSLLSGIVNYFGLFPSLKIFYSYEIRADKSNKIYRFLHFAGLYGINSIFSTPQKAAGCAGIAPLAPASLS